MDTIVYEEIMSNMYDPIIHTWLWAVETGSLNFIKWLHYTNKSGCTTKIMDSAASDGYFDIVYFLHQNRSEGCTTDAMDYAAKNGEFEILKFLHKYRLEGFTIDAIVNAANYGTLHIVEFLHTNRSEETIIDSIDYSMGAIDCAAHNGHLDVVKYLLDNGYKISESAMDSAETNEDYDMIRLLSDKLPSYDDI
jgi:hypothetical protein